MSMSRLLHFCLLLLCAAITLVYAVYLCCVRSTVAWDAVAEAEAEAGEAEADKSNDGLTAEQLKKLEEGTMAVGGGGECAVCLEEIAEGQAARVLPVCGHAFHRQCADDWLQHHATCPICRVRPLPPSQPQP